MTFIKRPSSLSSHKLVIFTVCLHGFQFLQIIFKPPPPVGAGGGYMFSGRPSVRASVRPCVRLSVILVVVLCFRDISSICWRIFAKLLSLVHLGTQMSWLRFWVKRSKFKVTPSRRRRTALDGVTLPSSATFSSSGINKLGYSRLGRSPKVKSSELLWRNFYRPDALPVTESTASKFWQHILTMKLKQEFADLRPLVIHV